MAAEVRSRVGSEPVAIHFVRLTFAMPNPENPNPENSKLADREAPFYWGVDVGGTGIKIGLVDSNGKVLVFEALLTGEAEGGPAAMSRVADAIALHEAALGVIGQVPMIGLGAPGPMDLNAGTLVQPPQLPSWWGFPIVSDLSTRTGRRVVFLNDANAAAYGEYWLGPGKISRSMLLLTLGTGVGGGIINEDELINGVNSFGSECGHILIDSGPNARACPWGGGHGQLEAYASASAVVARTIERLGGKDSNAAASSLQQIDPSILTAKEIYLAAKQNDALATEIIDETAFWLGVGVTTLVHTLDPGVVVLGGAMNFGGEDDPVGQRFLAGVVEQFRKRTFDNVFAGTTIKYASLGSDAGFLGLAGYAKKRFNHS